MPSGDCIAHSNFPSERFWGDGKWDSACSHPHSSLLYQVVGLEMCVSFCVCLCVPICMPVWLTHSAVNSVILGGPAVQGLHWHPTLILIHKQTQVHTHTQNPAQATNRHSEVYLRNTHSCAHTRTSTPAWLCYGSAFQFSAQLHSTVTYSKPRSLFSLKTHTHTLI